MLLPKNRSLIPQFCWGGELDATLIRAFFWTGGDSTGERLTERWAKAASGDGGKAEVRVKVAEIEEGLRE